MNDSKILGQLIALLRAGLSFHQAERVAGADQLSPSAFGSFSYLRGVVLSSGGRAADAMDRIRQVIEQNQTQQRKVDLAYASPRATVRLVLWLPIASLIIGQFSGLGSIQVLFQSPLALTSVLSGGILLAVGHLWSGKMLKKARLVEVDNAIYLDAIAIGLSAGLPIERALEVAAIDFANDIDEPVKLELQKILTLSKETGAGLTQLLREQADSIRGESNYKKSLALEKLSVRLMIPLGASVLPAFALIAVVPLALSFITENKGA